MLNPRQTAAQLRKHSALRPALALVLGSGFQNAIRQLQLETQLSYRRLTGFPPSRVPGHAGQVLWGSLGGLPVLVLSGRSHYYEGSGFERITFPIRVLAEYGVLSVLLTNAAGGINRRFRPGDFMFFKDHINFQGDNPLRGTAPPDRNRFVDLTHTYDWRMNRALIKAARRAKVRCHSGVYLAVSGPSYETPAEVRAFARLGADAVGMSTVPEAIVARQCGLAVAALSCITNRAAGLSDKTLSHTEVLEKSERVRIQAGRLLVEFAKEYASNP